MEDEGTLSYKDSISRLGKNAWYTRECVKKKVKCNFKTKNTSFISGYTKVDFGK